MTIIPCGSKKALSAIEVLTLEEMTSSEGTNFNCI
jgi:hypothetical protein